MADRVDRPGNVPQNNYAQKSGKESSLRPGRKRQEKSGNHYRKIILALPLDNRITFQISITSKGRRQFVLNKKPAEMRPQKPLNAGILEWRMQVALGIRKKEVRPVVRHPVFLRAFKRHSTKNGKRHAGNSSTLEAPVSHQPVVTDGNAKT